MKLLVISLFVFFSVGNVFGQEKKSTLFNSRNEIVVSIETKDLSSIPKLHAYSVDKIIGDKAQLYLNELQYLTLSDMGIGMELAPTPSMLKPVIMSKTLKEFENWDSYPDYDTYLNFVTDLAENYPKLCQIDSIGITTNQRLLLALKITKETTEETHKPKFFYTSSMHGDELAGYVLMLRLASYLLSEQETNEAIKQLLEEVEIYINPLANPDGTFASGNHTVYGATRGNANAIDINRNFPDPEYGDHPDGNAWQTETQAMMEYMKARNFQMAMNFHGGAEVVNFPWDTWSRTHADNDWYYNICRNYADTVHAYSNEYLTDLDNGITNGYAWYSIAGGRQDYSNYFIGTREVLIEISHIKLVDATELPNLWKYNYRSLVQYIENVQYGIKGHVSDMEGNSLPAKINVLDYDKDNSEVYANGQGVFYRYLNQGTYSIEVSALGYFSKVINDVQVTNHELNELSITLEPWPTAVSNKINPLISTFPNPAKVNQAIYIHNQGKEKIEYALHHMDGRLISQSTLSNKQESSLKVSSSGTYLLKINNGTYTFTKKIIVY